MKPTTWAELTLKLAAEGRLDAAGVERVGMAVTELAEEPPAPWYVVGLVGASAWIGSLLLLFFLIALRWIDSGAEYLGAGLVFMAVGIGLGRLGERLGRGLFAAHLGIAIALAGLAGATIGVHELWEASIPTWAALVAGAVLVFILHPHPVLRWLSVLAGVFGLAALIAVTDWHEGVYLLALVLALAAVYLWEHEPALDARGMGNWARPLALGLTLALPTLLFLSKVVDVFDLDRWWIVSAGLALALIHTVRRVAPLPAVLFVILFAGFAFDNPALIAALLLAMQVYARGRVALAGLLLAAFLGDIAYLLIELDVSLLHRSLLLMGGGLVLLAMRGVLRLTPWPGAEGSR